MAPKTSITPAQVLERYSIFVVAVFALVGTNRSDTYNYVDGQGERCVSNGIIKILWITMDAVVHSEDSNNVVDDVPPVHRLIRFDDKRLCG